MVIFSLLLVFAAELCPAARESERSAAVFIRLGTRFPRQQRIVDTLAWITLNKTAQIQSGLHLYAYSRCFKLANCHSYTVYPLKKSIVKH